MIERDEAIISNLQRFRCLTRDDIAEIHFQGLKNPITEANKALLRLRRIGEIEVSKERRMYLYFPKPASVKKDSSKIGHFLAIADFYKKAQRVEQPRQFEVEPKLGGKGLPEPDIFMIWKGAAFYVEIQNKVYSTKEMAEKLNRYEQYYLSRAWEQAEWQPREKKVAPIVWIYGTGKYNIGVRSFRVLQGNIEDVLKRK